MDEPTELRKPMKLENPTEPGDLMELGNPIKLETTKQLGNISKLGAPAQQDKLTGLGKRAKKRLRQIENAAAENVKLKRMRKRGRTANRRAAKLRREQQLRSESHPETQEVEEALDFLETIDVEEAKEPSDDADIKGLGKDQDKQSLEIPESELSFKMSISFSNFALNLDTKFNEPLGDDVKHEIKDHVLKIADCVTPKEDGPPRKRRRVGDENSKTSILQLPTKNASHVRGYRSSSNDGLVGKVQLCQQDKGARQGMGNMMELYSNPQSLSRSVDVPSPNQTRERHSTKERLRRLYGLVIRPHQSRMLQRGRLP